MFYMVFGQIPNTGSNSETVLFSQDFAYFSAKRCPPFLPVNKSIVHVSFFPSSWFGRPGEAFCRAVSPCRCRSATALLFSPMLSFAASPSGFPLKWLATPRRCIVRLSSDSVACMTLSELLSASHNRCNPWRMFAATTLFRDT